MFVEVVVEYKVEAAVGEGEGGKGALSVSWIVKGAYVVANHDHQLVREAIK